MASTTTSVVPTDSRKIVIRGLEKVQDAEKTEQRVSEDELLELPTLSMTMHEEEPLCELWNRIESCTCTFLISKHYINTQQLSASVGLRF